MKQPKKELGARLSQSTPSGGEVEAKPDAYDKAKKKGAPQKPVHKLAGRPIKSIQDLRDIAKEKFGNKPMKRGGTRFA